MSLFKVNVIFIFITFNEVHPVLSNGHEVSQRHSTGLSGDKHMGIEIWKRIDFFFKVICISGLENEN